MIIFEATDPISNRLILYKGSYDHIRSRHPEVKGIDIIRKSVVMPDYIYSNMELTKTIYERLQNSGLYFRVIAKTEALQPYPIITAFPSSRLYSKGNLIWYAGSKT